MQAVKEKALVIRAATNADKAQIREIRVKFHGNTPFDINVNYMVAERDGEILAMYGYKQEQGTRRALIVDLYGTDAHAWMKLYKYLLDWADRFGIQISGWVSVKNRHIVSFWREGFAPHAVLIRREPQVRKA